MGSHLPHTSDPIAHISLATMEPPHNTCSFGAKFGTHGHVQTLQC